MKMKDGTIGAPIFVLATCAAEGLDSHTVRDVFERLIRYGAWLPSRLNTDVPESGENDIACRTSVLGVRAARFKASGR